MSEAETRDLGIKMTKLQALYDAQARSRANPPPDKAAAALEAQSLKNQIISLRKTLPKPKLGVRNS